MDLSVAFLGTGGAVPSARRSTASLLVARGGERLMFDCGEGTQRQLQRSLGLVQVDEIYLTHFHADHFLGLPGLLKTYDLTDREAPLTVYGPRGLRDLFKTLGRLIGRIGLRARPGRTRARRRDRAARAPRSAPSRSSTACAPAATPWSRTSGPGRFDPEAAKRLGVPEGPAFAALQRGEAVAGLRRPGRARAGDGRVAPRPHDRRSPATPAPARRRSRRPRGAELLVHDASFSEEEAQRAADTGHSTVGQAAAVAREAEVKMLALVHISSRYHVGTVLEEAREVFEPTVAPRDFDLIEIPFPERGEPELVPNGARRGREGTASECLPAPRSDLPRGAAFTAAGGVRHSRTPAVPPAATLRPSFNPVPRGQEGAKSEREGRARAR